MGQDISVPGCGCQCTRREEVLVSSRPLAAGSCSAYATAGGIIEPSLPRSRKPATEEELNLDRIGVRISSCSTHIASEADKARRVSNASIRGSFISDASLEHVSECASSESDRESTHSSHASDAKSPNWVRRMAICAGTLEKHVFQPPVFVKSEEIDRKLLTSVESCSLIKTMLSRAEMKDLVKAFSVVTFSAGERIVKQGGDGDSLFAVLEGSVDCYLESTAAMASRDVRGWGRRISETSNEISASSSNGKLADAKGDFITSRAEGSLFGEVSVVLSLKRSLSVYAKTDCKLGRLESQVYQKSVVQHQFHKRQSREECLRSVKLLELLDDEEIAKLADALLVKTYEPGDVIIHQGEQGEELFIVQSGECVASVRTYDEEQEVKRYSAGDLFGELALLKNAKRAATITAVTRVEAMYTNRLSFQRMLGPLSNLMKSQYIRDPRKLIADFYMPGDHRGPRGALVQQGLEQELDIAGPSSRTVTSWFAVFRPTSRDAIAKMLGGFAVGKGLNIKGKSAKKNRLSGFVPFVQISENSDKDKIKEVPSSSSVRVFYKTAAARTDALHKLLKIRDRQAAYVSGSSGSGGMGISAVASCKSTESDCMVMDHGASEMEDAPEDRIETEDHYIPKAFGLKFSGALLREAYIMRPDLTALVGWETGRSSEPAYMDTNLAAVTNDQTEPQVVLLQHDEGNSMNPQGLLIAYAEATVKPVVSDFDAFLIASRGMEYEQLPPEQAELINWSLQNAADILADPNSSSWSSRWLLILRRYAEQGFHPSIPKYGFGDPTSYQLIGDVISQVAGCGAVRHGAECFNSYFPQELDDEYLVIWEGCPDKPWVYKTEPELRAFLIDRVREGFSFPLNPIWPVRDAGWYDVWEALQASSPNSLGAWYPPESGIVEKVHSLHEQFPGGFVQSPESPKSDCSDIHHCQRNERAHAKSRQSWNPADFHDFASLAVGQGGQGLNDDAKRKSYFGRAGRISSHHLQDLGRMSGSWASRLLPSRRSTNLQSSNNPKGQTPVKSRRSGMSLFSRSSRHPDPEAPLLAHPEAM